METKKRQVKIKINGVEYTSLDEMPEDVKKMVPEKFLKAMRGDESALKQISEKPGSTIKVTKIKRKPLLGGSAEGIEPIQTKITIDGKDYHSIEEVPEEFKERVKSLLEKYK